MTDTHDSELDDILALIKYSVEYGQTHGGGHPAVTGIKRHGVNEAKSALTHWRDKAVLTVEKAYGSCRNCYGKGYASYNGYATARGAKWRISGPVKFCACERGIQLERFVKEAEAKAREDEARRSKAIMEEYDREIAINVQTSRIASLTPPEKGADT